MYYGEDALKTTLWLDLADDIPTAVRCWVLGDSLLCHAFKNHAMDRIYTRYSPQIFNPNPMRAVEVRYVCDNTAPESKLRRFYLDYVSDNFANPVTICGTTEEWDEIMLENDDARILLLKRMRSGPGAVPTCVKNNTAYYDEDRVLKMALRPTLDPASQEQQAA